MSTYNTPSSRPRGRPPKNRSGNNDSNENLETTQASEAASQISGGDKHSLFSQVMNAGASSKGSSTSQAGIAAITKIVDNWATDYDNSRSNGLQKIIQFIMHSAGCKGRVDKSLYESTVGAGFSNLITKMVEQFDEDNADYPFIINNAAYRRFKMAFTEFIAITVKQCQRDIIYDSYLMDNIIQLLTEMCNSKVRAFRHTSSIASMKLMTSLVKVALSLHGNLEQTTRQLEVEQAKTARQRSANKIKSLDDRRKDLEDHSSEIEDMLNSIFKGIFAHRYRDVVSEVRACCMEEIGNWMKIFPKVFLTDSYLKYVGWTLNDKNKEVRIKCINALLLLYRENDLYKQLALFTKRFKSRLISMTADKENDVAVLATKLCTTITQNFKSQEDIFTVEECESVYMLVFCKNRPLAVAAAEFLWEKIFDTEDKKANGTSHTKTGKRKSKRIPLIQTLVSFYIESELHDHTRYLVDALWDTKASDLLRDWQAMTELLIEEPIKDEEKLEPNAELALIDLILSTVMHAAKGPPPGRIGAPKRNNLTVKEKNKIEHDKNNYTEHFIEYLPKLITKFQASPERLNLLLQIPRHFQLELYVSNRQEAQLDKLLEQLANVIQLNIQDNVLQNCSQIFELLCSDTADLYYITQRAKLRRDLAADRISNNFCNSLQEYKSIIDEINQNKSQSTTRLMNDTNDITFQEKSSSLNQKRTDATYASFMWLKRYSWLNMHNDVNSAAIQAGRNMTEICTEIIQSQQNSDTSMGKIEMPMPELILVEALRVLHSDNQWNLINLLKQAEEPEKTEVLKLKEQTLTTFNLMNFCLIQKHESLAKLRETAYMSLCDLLQCFGPTLTDHSSISCFDRSCLSDLLYMADDNMADNLVDFVKTRCFDDIEKEDAKFLRETARNDDEVIAAKIEIVHNRRRLLAGFCKLIVYKRISMKFGNSIFGNYIKSFSDYGDVIKHTISKCREMSQIEAAETLVMSLINLYKSLQNNNSDQTVDVASQDFIHIKELSRRFSLTFGLEQLKIREAMARLHKDGIDFALENWPIKDPNNQKYILCVPPANASFLDILMEFSGKLMKQDRLVVLEYLINRVEVGNEDEHRKIWSSQERTWVPIMSYRNSLQQSNVWEKQRRGRHESGKSNDEINEELNVPPSPFRKDDYQDKENSVASLSDTKGLTTPTRHSTRLGNTALNMET